MEAALLNRQIANAYYNLGLSKAQKRDLTGAAAALKESLRFDKYQTDARNLLGLIYCETGEAGAALTQWVISLNLQTEDNLAEEYLLRVRESGGYLETADQAARKFNQALDYAHTDNEDLAILLLTRMLDDFPNYVKAQKLLGLLYLHREDYLRAGRCLYQALRVDPYDPVARRYMEIAKKHTGRAEVENRKIKNAFSHRQMQDDDIIMPPSYRENTGWQSVLNILVGLLLGAAVLFFLVTPALTENLNQEHNAELLSQLDTLNRKNLELDALARELDEALAGREAAESRLETVDEDYAAVISQYQNLAGILQALRDGDAGTAALLYTETDFSVFDGTDLAGLSQAAAAEAAEQGGAALLAMADEAMEGAGGAAEAAGLCEKALTFSPDSSEILYKLGTAYYALGLEEEADGAFERVIELDPESSFADAVRELRGY